VHGRALPFTLGGILVLLIILPSRAAVAAARRLATVLRPFGFGGLERRDVLVRLEDSTGGTQIVHEIKLDSEPLEMCDHVEGLAARFQVEQASRAHLYNFSNQNSLSTGLAHAVDPLYHVIPELTVHERRQSNLVIGHGHAYESVENLLLSIFRGVLKALFYHVTAKFMQAQLREIIQQLVNYHTPVLRFALHDDVRDHIVPILVNSEVLDVLENLIKNELQLRSVKPL